eukprot:9398669-Pyramimonas_sp.AAC.1
MKRARAKTPTGPRHRPQTASRDVRYVKGAHGLPNDRRLPTTATRRSRFPEAFTLVRLYARSGNQDVSCVDYFPMSRSDVRPKLGTNRPIGQVYSDLYWNDLGTNIGSGHWEIVYTGNVLVTRQRKWATPVYCEADDR